MRIIAKAIVSLEQWLRLANDVSQSRRRGETLRPALTLKIGGGLAGNHATYISHSTHTKLATSAAITPRISHLTLRHRPPHSAVI